MPPLVVGIPEAIDAAKARKRAELRAAVETSEILFRGEGRRRRAHQCDHNRRAQSWERRLSRRYRAAEREAPRLLRSETSALNKRAAVFLRRPLAPRPSAGRSAPARLFTRRAGAVSAPILLRLPLHRPVNRILHLGPVGQAAGTAPAQLKQLVSCSKCGTDRYNCVLSRRNWTRPKKPSVKSARSIWSRVRRLDPMKDKNPIAAAKQVNDSRVRHFSRATDFSNTFQNVRWFTRRELRKYSPGGDGIFVPIFAG